MAPTPDGGRDGIRSSGTPIGNPEQSTSGASGLLLYPANAYDITDGTSISVGCGCVRANDATFAATAPTGMTNQDSAASVNGSCGLHAAAAGTGFDAASVSTIGTRGAFVVEIQGPGSAPVDQRAVARPGGPRGRLLAR